MCFSVSHWPFLHIEYVALVRKEGWGVSPFFSVYLSMPCVHFGCSPRRSCSTILCAWFSLPRWLRFSMPCTLNQAVASRRFSGRAPFTMFLVWDWKITLRLLELGDRKMRFIRGDFVIVSILIAIVYPFIYIFMLLPIKISIYHIRTCRYCTKHGKEITGTIVDYEQRWGLHSNYAPVFRFRYKGVTERKAAFQSFCFFVKTGFPKKEEMQIYYCETHPDFVMMKGYKQYISNVIVGVLFLCLLIFVSVMMLWQDFPGTLASFVITAAILFIHVWRKRRKNRQ